MMALPADSVASYELAISVAISLRAKWDTVFFMFLIRLIEDRGMQIQQGDSQLKLLNSLE